MREIYPNIDLDSHPGNEFAGVSDLCSDVQFYNKPRLTGWRALQAASFVAVSALPGCSQIKFSTTVIPPESYEIPTDPVSWEYKGVEPINCDPRFVILNGSRHSLRMGDGTNIFFKYDINGDLEAISSNPDNIRIPDKVKKGKGFGFKRGVGESKIIGNCGRVIGVFNKLLKPGEHTYP